MMWGSRIYWTKAENRIMLTELVKWANGKTSIYSHIKKLQVRHAVQVMGINTWKVQ